MIDSQYMNFEDITPAGRKTKIIIVTAKRDGATLGEVSWWGAWRQYVFIPNEGTVFNKGCMNDIIAVIDKLMAERK